MTKQPKQQKADNPAPTATEAGPEEAPDDATHTAPMEALQAENAELKDRLLRALAEAENIRRRAERDVETAKQYGIAALAGDLLPVADNLERALASVPPEVRGAAAAFRDGVTLTERELQKVLERHGLVKHEPLGQPFDPNLHEAMFEDPSPEAAPGTVTKVLAPGYSIGSRILRAAKVGVAKASP